MNSGQCHIVLRDVSKAFDKVWHPGLKYKLLNLNLPPLAETLLCNLLDERKAKIKIKTTYSDIININCGVPQGSGSSPTLYTIYTHDIPPSITGTNIIYADDITQIINYEGKSKEIMIRKTKREAEHREKHLEAQISDREGERESTSNPRYDLRSL